MADAGECGGCAGSVAASVAGTFIATCLAIAVAGLLYRQWRRHKGKHLVLVTDPEIVDEAYAFDNPCFKDCTPAAGKRSLERSVSLTLRSETNATTPVTTPLTTNAAPKSPKDANHRWSTPWSNFGRLDKRRNLDDSCLGAKMVNVVALRSRDFTGLGFNVCGNMREGIFVKDLLHRGPASESGRIHPGDRITSVTISFRSMVYEDALTILSYASPYDVEIAVESGGDATTKPTSLLKRSVGPSARHLYHPLYRSQSIPELFHQQRPTTWTGKHAANGVAPKRLHDPNDSSHHPVAKSPKSTEQPLGRSPPTNQYTKYGVKVLPALDPTAIHRVENQNEHNTNLERHHSRKLDKTNPSAEPSVVLVVPPDANGIDVPDRVSDNTEVPTEVHNAGMAARRNRKGAEPTQRQRSTESSTELEDPPAGVTKKTSGKRRAPAPPARTNSSDGETGKEEPLEEKVSVGVETEVPKSAGHVDSADVTVHDAPDEDADSVYRKAASLGDLSKYESRASPGTLERAQSLDMTGEKGAGSKRRAKQPSPQLQSQAEVAGEPGEVGSSKLKKSSEWGTLEDAIRADDSPAPDKAELYNLPLTRQLTHDFIRAERLFDPEEDNALARLADDRGRVVKSPSPEAVEAEFLKEHPPPDYSDDDEPVVVVVEDPLEEHKVSTEDVERVIRYFDAMARDSPKPEEELYIGREEVVEEPVTKETRSLGCPGCEHRHERHVAECARREEAEDEPSYRQTIRVEEEGDKEGSHSFETHFAKPIISVADTKEEEGEVVVARVSVSSEDGAPRMAYVTEITVPAVEELLSENEEIIAIMEGGSKPAGTTKVTLNSNGKLPPGVKPPVPPRRSDATARFGSARSVASEGTTVDGGRQVVYLSEESARRFPAKDEDAEQVEINPWDNRAGHK
ncbi:uncharacterized protein LOC106637753 [Copidosoma floridanum]|uniref:uncharacterized protein LOC106637753 n=1 Tax=Copidosoma floridanum TaxID=29053 RepID=UPI0006C9D143|nr:uncharacterized protein LOC106637753 [Copidosoma floridanum]